MNGNILNDTMLAEGVREILRSLEIPAAADDADLLGSGLVDSFGLVEILTALESRFGIAVDMQALELDDVRSVNALARYVRQRQGGAGAGAEMDESAA